MTTFGHLTAQSSLFDKENEVVVVVVEEGGFFRRLIIVLKGPQVLYSFNGESHQATY